MLEFSSYFMVQDIITLFMGIKNWNIQLIFGAFAYIIVGSCNKVCLHNFVEYLDLISSNAIGSIYKQILFILTTSFEINLAKASFK